MNVRPVLDPSLSDDLLALARACEFAMVLEVKDVIAGVGFVGDGRQAAAEWAAISERLRGMAAERARSA